MSSVLNFISGALSILCGIKAGKAAKRQGKQGAAAELRVTQEKIRNLGFEERALAGSTRAAAAGGGVKANVGSPLTILAEQARAFAREKQFVTEVGATKAAASVQRGRNVASQARYGGFERGLSSFASGFSLLGL